MEMCKLLSWLVLCLDFESDEQKFQVEVDVMELQDSSTATFSILHINWRKNGASLF